ncbi:hypothetical protein [Streptomyces sp. LN785]|uniref:hypothetical protein n=1 Tax=Streptomyces sp. LN785 TaxID=3112983 RepID=UPI0037162081
MHSDTVIEKDRQRRDRRRDAGAPRSRAGAQEGPVFVDGSGRRARLLRRAGIALGLGCAGYVAVLGLAFMGGISMSPSELLPFDGAPSAQGGPGAKTPPDGAGTPPSGPPAVPASAASAPATTGTGR